MGFAADSCNVMFGRNHSVSTLLKELMPNLLTVPCSCHSAYLCASYACKRHPKEMEDVMRGIYNHFSRSSARKREFAMFQEFVHAAQHTIESSIGGLTKIILLLVLLFLKRLSIKLSPLRLMSPLQMEY